MLLESFLVRVPGFHGHGQKLAGLAELLFHGSGPRRGRGQQIGLEQQAREHGGQPLRRRGEAAELARGLARILGQAYRQALQEAHPLFGVFLVVLVDQGPVQLLLVLHFRRQGGHLAFAQHPIPLMRLFRALGQPVHGVVVEGGAGVEAADLGVALQGPVRGNAHFGQGEIARRVLAPHDGSEQSFDAGRAHQALPRRLHQGGIAAVERSDILVQEALGEIDRVILQGGFQVVGQVLHAEFVRRFRGPKRGQFGGELRGLDILQMLLAFGGEHEVQLQVVAQGLVLGRVVELGGDLQGGGQVAQGVETDHAGDLDGVGRAGQLQGFGRVHEAGRQMPAAARLDVLDLREQGGQHLVLGPEVGAGAPAESAGFDDGLGDAVQIGAAAQEPDQAVYRDGEAGGRHDRGSDERLPRHAAQTVARYLGQGLVVLEHPAEEQEGEQGARPAGRFGLGGRGGRSAHLGLVIQEMGGLAAGVLERVAGPGEVRASRREARW